MQTRWTYIVTLVILTTGQLLSQLSPGDLSEPHAHLEGMANCTQCHTLGKKVSSAKCLACHTRIDDLLSSNRGYHSNRQVREQDCIACHSDHHGRKFEMIRFDVDHFDHGMAGYTLEGAHMRIECRECHNPDHVVDAELKRNPDTYLGLDQACLSCHADFHQGTLAHDCRSCHDFEAFRPAPGFDHSKTDYDLRGAHQRVDCMGCHQMTQKNGTAFQEFSGIAFGDCVSCHRDPHNDLGASCVTCHNETSFKSVSGMSKFNHNVTNFELKGSHTTVACFTCHEKGSGANEIFKDQLGIKTQDCKSCHVDVHEGKFGQDCAECHNEESFMVLNSMDLFDHNVTNYPLEGRHTDVDCRSCHISRYTDPLDFGACHNCHSDYHDGQFTVNSVQRDCAECHSVHEGFGVSLFDLAQHATTGFPLQGAHIATPCFACHLDEEQWIFRDIGSECRHCHEDIHDGYISQDYYPEANCTHCHNEESWASLTFDHDLTSWTLVGKHTDVECRSCHFEDSENTSTLIQVFNTLEADCVQCHANVHGEQFAVEGETECNRCHDAYSWFPTNFDHDQTAFPLKGAHARVECRQCHRSVENSGVITVQYKMQRFECIDCHQ